MTVRDFFPTIQTMKQNTPASTSQPEGRFGFFQSLLSLILRDNDPERERKRALKEIAKKITRSKYNFYKARGEEALPKLARFYYDIYKVTAPAQILLDNVESSGVFRSILVEQDFTEEHRALRDACSEEAIREALNTGDKKAVVDRIKQNLIKLYAFFDNERVRQIEETYTLFYIFNQFINFDYYFLLRKFDSRFPEHDFGYNPNFDTINGDYVSEDLKDFLDILPLISAESNWDGLFDALREYKGNDVVSRSAWKKLLRNIIDVKQSRVLEHIVQYSDKEPKYRAKATMNQEHIVEGYLTKLKSQTEMTMQKLIQEEQSRKIDKMVIEVFGTTAVSRLNNYTEKANMSFSKKMLGGFIHVAPLNYLKAFLLDYVKKDIREVTNLLIVQGQWPARITSQQLSESFHTLLQVTEELLAFDESLSAEGEAGMALWGYFKRSDRDPNAMTALRQKLKDTNDKAYAFIQVSGQQLVSIGKNLKQCIEDYEKPKHELVTNWKQINTMAGGNLRDQMVTCYKKVFYFVQLLQLYVKKKPIRNSLW